MSKFLFVFRCNYVTNYMSCTVLYFTSNNDVLLKSGLVAGRLKTEKK